MFSTVNVPRAWSPDIGLLLVGHGTRDLAGQAEFAELAAGLKRAAGELPVEACLLELVEPDIATGIDRLVERGVRQIVVAPLLLFAAGHAKRDIPNTVSEALRRHPNLTASLLPPLGCHPRILELSQLRYQQAMDFRAHTDFLSSPDAITPKTTLLLVGRGSTDPEAIRELGRFAQLRAVMLPDVAVETCFYALAEPRLPDVLLKVSTSSTVRIVVQPHLLFSGDVLGGIASAVKAAEQSAPELPRQFLLTAPLGPDRRVIETLLDLTRTACAPS